MPRSAKPPAKPKRSADAEAIRQDGQTLRLWVQQMHRRVEWKSMQEQGKERWRLIAYVDDMAIPNHAVYPSREAALAIAEDLARRAAG